MEAKPIEGIRFKMNVTMDPIDGYTLEDTEWDVEVFAVGKKGVVFPKSEAIMSDANNYLLPIDSAKIGHGKYYYIITVRIPDADFPDGFRVEKWQTYSGIQIYAKYDV